MTDLPNHVEIHEEGPREGFQIEPGPIPSADKIRLIEALAETGLHHIQACSFVNTRLVPGWADAEAVVAGFTAKPGVEYTGLFFNGNGLDRALAFKDKLTIHGSISLTASEGLHAQEPQPQPCRECRGDEEAQRRAVVEGRSGQPGRGDGGVRLQLPGRYCAGPGDLDAGGRPGDRRRRPGRRSRCFRWPTRWDGQRRRGSNA